MVNRRLYLAPLEEVTGYIFRNALCDIFGGVEKYFTPFVMPTQKKILRTREKRDISPDNNKVSFLVPQILTSKSEEFIDTVAYMYELGYREINLNAGCPSATVTRKGKGSGLLADTDALNRFLYDIFEGIDKLDFPDKLNISIKTRIGIEDEKEFSNLIKVFNEYQLSELIIHSRLQADFYNGVVRTSAYEHAVANSKNPLVFNGDVIDLESYEELYGHYQDNIPVMIGRGAITNPGIFRELKSGKKASLEEMREFHDRILHEYVDILGEKDALFKMKEVWYYLGLKYNSNPSALKTIKKTKSLAEFQSAANNCLI